MADAKRSEFLSLTMGATMASGNGRHLALSWPPVRLVVLEQRLALGYRADWARGLAHAVSGGRSGDDQATRRTDSSGGVPPPKT